MRRMMMRMFLTWSPPVSQFPTGDTRATTTAKSNSYHARVVGDIGLELEWEREWFVLILGFGREGFDLSWNVIGLMEPAEGSSSSLYWEWKSSSEDGAWSFRISCFSLMSSSVRVEEVKPFEPEEEEGLSRREWEWCILQGSVVAIASAYSTRWASKRWDNDIDLREPRLGYFRTWHNNSISTCERRFHDLKGPVLDAQPQRIICRSLPEFKFVYVYCEDQILSRMILYVYHSRPFHLSNNETCVTDRFHFASVKTFLRRLRA